MFFSEIIETFGFERLFQRVLLVFFMRRIWNQKKKKWRDWTKTWASLLIRLRTASWEVANRFLLWTNKARKWKQKRTYSVKIKNYCWREQRDHEEKIRLLISIFAIWLTAHEKLLFKVLVDFYGHQRAGESVINKRAADATILFKRILSFQKLSFVASESL